MFIFPAKILQNEPISNLMETFFISVESQTTSMGEKRRVKREFLTPYVLLSLKVKVKTTLFVKIYEGHEYNRQLFLCFIFGCFLLFFSFNFQF